MILRDSVLDWFLTVVECALKISSRHNIINNVGLQNLENLIKSSKKYSKELTRVHLPVPPGKKKASYAMNLDKAINTLSRVAQTQQVQCKMPGGIPPELTAEIAEHVRVFLGPLYSKYLKKTLFQLCEDVIAAAELGAFLSLVEVERTEGGDLIYHYVHAVPLSKIFDDVKRVKAYLEIKQLASCLIWAPRTTFITGISSAIAKYISGGYIGVGKIHDLYKEGIIVDYLRLEPGKVLNIRGVERFLINELIYVLYKKRVAKPLYMLIKLYPSRRSFEKLKTSKELTAYKTLMDTVDGVSKYLFMYVENIQGFRLSREGKLLPVRNEAYIYEASRKLDLFIERLERERQLADTLDGLLSKRFSSKVLSKYTTKKGIIINVVREMASRLGST